jgi:hypothetical protein
MKYSILHDSFRRVYDSFLHKLPENKTIIVFGVFIRQISQGGPMTHLI